MALRDIFKLSWKTFINPLGWVDYQSLKEQNKTIVSTLKTLFTQPVPQETETYEQARKRLDVSDAETQRAAKTYRIYALLFFVCGCIVFIYSFYLLIELVLMGFILGLAVSGLFFSFAFKYDFWALQIKRRKLGLTFEEWKHHLMGDKKRKSSHD